MNKLADEVDKNAGLSRLTLFSPCKVRESISFISALNLEIFSLLFRLFSLCFCLLKENAIFQCVDKCFSENNWQKGRWIS